MNNRYITVTLDRHKLPTCIFHYELNEGACCPSCKKEVAILVQEAIKESLKRKSA